MKIFVVGAGAIGCEIMKNLAMLGVGSQGDGVIYLTDPDVIEVSQDHHILMFIGLKSQQTISIQRKAFEIGKVNHSSSFNMLNEPHDEGSYFSKIRQDT